MQEQAIRRVGIEPKRRNGVAAPLWVAFLLAILAFLVIYPVLMLLLGALTDTNPVVDGFSLRHLSIANFLDRARQSERRARRWSTR